MRMYGFSVLDKAVNAFLPPFFDRAKGSAIRSFQEACNDEKHAFFRHRGDYVLYCIGEWEDATGIFVGYEPQRVLSGLEVAVGADPGDGEDRYDRRPM